MPLTLFQNDTSHKGPGGAGGWKAESEPAVPWQPGGPSVAWGTRASMARRAREGLSCPALGWGSLTAVLGQLGVPWHRKDMKLLKNIQRRATKVETFLEEEQPCEEGLRALGLLSLEETEGRPQCSHSFLVRDRQRAGTDRCSVVTVTGQREWPEAVSGQVWVGYQEKVLPPEGGWALNSLPRTVVTAPG